MGKVRDLTGQRFGRLVALCYEIKPCGNVKQLKAHWKCICDCGNFITILSRNLISGNTRSCGCLQIDEARDRFNKHGMKDSRFYHLWASMKQRTTDVNHASYGSYGGAGITLDPSWFDFRNFRDDMYASYLEHVAEYGERNTTIDRKDNTKGYSKDNCRWATYSVQNLNRRFNRKLGDNVAFKQK
jgi:hypothetical protein